MNNDTSKFSRLPISNPLRLLAEAWDPKRMDALLLCVSPDQAHGHPGQGDFIADETGRARRGPGLIYTGAQILKPDGLEAIEDTSFSLNLLWNGMLAEKRLFLLPYSGLWCDVGRPESIALAEAMLGESHV